MQESEVNGTYVKEVYSIKGQLSRHKVAAQLSLGRVKLHTVGEVLYNNNNNNPICKAPECQKTSVALADRNSRAN